MIDCHDVIKIYTDEELKTRVAALRGIDMAIKQGEIVSIIGPSGSGKSTLIKILAGIESISSGVVQVGDYQLETMSPKELLKYRLKNVGLVHQFPERTLFLSGTVADNLTFASSIYSKSKKECDKRNKEILDSLGIKHLEKRRVSFLSGGEMIRTAIACMLAKNAKIILCDEPTGQLDSENTNRVKQFLRDVVQNFGTTVLVVTHDLRFLKGVDRTCEIQNGRVSSFIDVLDGELRNYTEFPIDFIGRLDSTQNVRIPSNIYKMLKLEKDVVFRVSEDSKVEIVHPKGIAPDKMDLRKIHKTKKLKISPLADNYFDEMELEIQLQNVSKIYKQKKTYDVHAVEKVDLSVYKGELVFIIGPSGSGKTTLFKIITGMVPVSEGQVKINSHRLDELNDGQRAEFRRKNIGIVSQQGDLHPTISVKKNLFLKDILSKKFLSLKKFPENEINDHFNMFEIEHRQDSFPLEISGGELQRASLAIAKYGQPRILILDEPTANMDSELANNVMEQLFQLHQQLGITMLITTHDINLVRDGSRVIELLDGKINKDGLAYVVEE
ncbi:MAG: ATP-binding cassette domain-containing protein [Asgard group archaeon]|nr:ATP-binding cassette domain-containing protein [Asgard group archaeon]